MTKRDFELIAKAIATFGYPQERERIARHFASVLANTNDRFNAERFVSACVDSK